MGAAVVRREQLDVFVAFPPIELVLDAIVGEVHLAVEIRQVVLARPVADLGLFPVGPAVAIGAIAVVLLQELLVRALQILLEDDAPDVEAAVFVSEACLLLAIRRVEARIVIDLTGATDTSVERLRRLIATVH